MSELNYNYPRHHAYLFALSLLVYEISTYLSNDMIMPGMIDVVHLFHAPLTMVSASLTVFLLGAASLQIFLGPLSDRFGRRPVMLGGAIFFLLCTFFLALSSSITMFMLGRFLQGMGICFIGVVGYAALQEIFAEKDAVSLLAIMGSITILAPLAGPLLGSVITHYLGWRSVFFLVAIIVTIDLIGLWYFMPETVGKTRRDNVFVHYTSLHISVVHRNYVALLKNKKYMLGVLCNGLSSIPFVAWIGTAPILLIESAHLSLLAYGLWQIPVFATSILGNLAMRAKLKYANVSTLITLGSYIILISAILTTALSFFMHTHYIGLVIGLSLYAFGAGFVSAPLNRATLFATDIPKGTASALLSLGCMLLIAAGNQLFGWILAMRYCTLFYAGFMICGLAYFVCITLFNASADTHDEIKRA